jgi:dihydrofolate synthase/folylpolyglutamate synthase
MMQRTSLNDWLQWLEGLHATTIDMGLERVRKVWTAMQLQPSFPVIMVAGTNGKGSVCAMLSTMYQRAGFKVGCYTSPHIAHYNERVAIDLQPVSDERIINSFAAIDAARGDTSLTYFEFGTLGAMHSFIEEKVDVAIMEVGLGGRLDAVNIFEPDVSVVVSVDIDHAAILGDNREDIGFEKAGIYRPGKPAICADPQPPQRLLDHAAAIGADLKLVGRDYSYSRMDNQWSFQMGSARRHALPMPALRGGYQLGNAAAALAVLDCLHERLPVGIGALKQGWLKWNGRDASRCCRAARWWCWMLVTIRMRSRRWWPACASCRLPKTATPYFPCWRIRTWLLWPNWPWMNSMAGSWLALICRAGKVVPRLPRS